MSVDDDTDERDGRDGLIDAMASALLRVDERELAEEAAASNEDMADAAASLRAQFLERVAAARERASGPLVHAAQTLVEVDEQDASSLLATGELEHGDDAPTQLAIGRYPLLRRLGAGGMGVVYAAYDEILDRRVAIKVLHDHIWDIDGRRRERLLREAQAMARVTHPNVITVHEVGTADDQLFVAMEFVAGPTLKDWLAAEPRSWRAIVRVFRQIADGLAALHDAGLVHRDVKPTNVLIGDDGRVRVLDLGLVSADHHELSKTCETTSSSSSSSSNRMDLTKTGERLGTPAYMSREQFLGLEQTPASDIFSLSISLYEALYGVHPFMAESFYELQANVVDGRITPPPSSGAAPSWLHALVLRGLAPDPKDRPSSMRALSAALAKDPGRARWRTIGTLAVAVVAAIAGVMISSARAPAPVLAPACDGAVAAIAAVWDEGRAAEIRAAMVSTQRPYANALANPVIAGLHEYAANWAQAHHQTCRDHARGEHSAALLDARMACLDRRRQAFVETVDMLAQADADMIDHAGEMVAKLPRLEPCDDLAALAARRPPPADAQVARAVAQLDAKLVRAETWANAGRVDEATTLARAVAAEAETLDLPATVAAALLSEARASINTQVDRSVTAALLERALTIAIAEELDGLATEAMIRRLYIRGLIDRSNEAALADLPIAEAMLARAGNDPELHALLLNNGGAIRLAAGDREGARVAFERSLAIKERLLGEDHLELALGLANLGMLSPDAATRSRLHRRMIAIYERRIGHDHPQTLDARLLAALYTANPEHAGAALRELCPRFVIIDELRLAGECELERGRIELARGHVDLALQAFALARERLFPDSREAGEDGRRVLLDAYLSLGPSLHSEASQPAIAELRKQVTLADTDPSRPWWIRLEQAERGLLLGTLLVKMGEPSAAIDPLERAIAGLEQIVDQAPPIEGERLLAGSRAALAQALAQAPGAAQLGEASTIDALANAARSFYARWPDAYTHRLEQLDALAISHPL